LRVFVTGATGFVGSHVAQALVDRGDEVVALVRARESWLGEIPGVKRARGDVLDAYSLAEAFSSPFDLVVHCAGLTSAPRNMDYYRVNALGTYNLVRALEKAPWRPGLVVYISSLAAAGPGEVNEECEERPLTPYGESKLYGEYFVVDSGLPCLVLRPPVIFGPRDTDVLQFFKLVKRGWAPAFFRKKRLSLVYVRTLVEALLFLLERGAQGTYFVADGTFSWWEVAERVSRIVGKKLRPFPLPQGFLVSVAGVSQFYRCLTGRPVLLSKEKVQEMRQDAWVCETSRLSSMGFVPSLSLDEALRETLEWYEEKGYL